MDRGKEKYDQQLAASRAWKKANPERHAELVNAYRARNPDRSRAHNAVGYAVRSGLLTRGPCEVCGTDQKVHAHHHDYSKPLEVRWLCFRCHKLAHPVGDDDKAVKFHGAKRARLFGPENTNAKLSADDVRLARQMLALGISQEKIGRVFGVTQVTISRLKLGVYYATVA